MVTRVFAAACALLLPATSAFAADWWLVFGGGDKPQREILFLDQASIDVVRDPSRLVTIDLGKKLSDDDLIDFVRVEGVTVYESAQAPAKMAAQYRVKCRDKMVATTFASQLWRHGKIENLPDQQWASVEQDEALAQVHAFICAPDQRDANSMLHITDEYDPMTLTWKMLWTDGTEPQWTSTRSAEEINAEIDARLADTRELLARGAAMATANLQKIESDRELTIAAQKKLFSQMAQKASPVLHSWMGLPETALVASWGIPQQSYTSGSSRFLYYGYGYTSTLVDENGNEFPQETWACHMTFEVRDGVVADYRSHGNYCQTAAANLPYGRPRDQ